MNSNFTIESILLRPSVQEYFYNYENHKKLLKDELRLNSFRKAIMKAVKPGDVVMDIGAGTGILSKFACEAGAREVYLIEENENILNYAKKNLTNYGYAENCNFIAERSNRLKTKFINNKVDVIISETIGSLGLNEGVVETIFDAKRFLKSDGIIMPSSVSLYYAYLDFQLNHPISEPVILKMNGIIKIESIPQKILEINFNELTSNSFQYEFMFDYNKKNKALGIWFEANLFNNIIISNSPNLGCKTSWGLCVVNNYLFNKLIFKISNNCGTSEFLSFDFNSLIKHKYTQKLIKI